ncbi:sensor histidine kinase [Aquibacillus sediminis]|uniref:sensor histidine kinase n=1 Tax=Aquibacillus sediminis TaxID=2574734 RepID=UPI001FE34F67|nr:HAMP domain-containing sensor histidine kinase [Aquibacillus sediminis]
MFRKFHQAFLFRLTLLNVVVVASFIIVTGFALYNTACLLVDGMVTVEKQSRFNQTLFGYLIIFSLAAIVIGSTIHFYLTRKLIRPLRELITSTKRMKKGHYPAPIKTTSNDETGQLVHHFNDMVQQLKYNEEHRHKLISDLSHEFRTPLSNLNGYLGALKNEVMVGDPQLYESLYEESKRLTKMVKQLEQLKEWDHVSNQTFLDKQSINMAELIDQSVELFQWLLEKHNIPIELQVKDGFVLVNKDAMMQVMSNLIENAIRYNQGTTPICVKGELCEDVYKVSVIGNGHPIPEKDRGKVFDRFYRVDNSRGKETGGSGLGLSISKEIVEHHHGQVGLDSTKDDKHTFWFTIHLQK